MSVALLTIGTELTRGELQNSNTTWLAAELSDLGYEVTHMLTVDDDDGRIINAMKRLSAEHSILITTGGLGPTTDDRTTACAAAVLGVPLVRDQNTILTLEARFLSFGRTMAPSNKKQADFPEGAIILPNERGTAPGFFVHLDRCYAFFTPGVPLEMMHMFHREIVHRLPPPKAPVTTVRMRTFGMPESEVNDRLAGIEERHSVTIGYRASHSEIEVKVLATGMSGETKEALTERANLVADEVQERLGDIVYTRDQRSMPQVLGELLVERGLTLGTAESCTGGLVGEMLTAIPGSSRYFVGGIISYKNAIKENLLGVRAEDLMEFGAVSEAVVRSMAEGARRALGADIALSISGIAGPDGGTDEKPVGLVHWAVSHAGGTDVYHRVFPGTRAQIQRRAALSGLWAVRSVLLASTK